MQTDRVSQLPFFDTTNAALGSWKHDQLADTETSLMLMGTITNSRNQSHHALANLNRALVRARSRHRDLAFKDANNASLCLLSHTLMPIPNYRKSIKICPPFNGHITPIGGGKKSEGCRVYDLAFRRRHTHGRIRVKSHHIVTCAKAENDESR